VTAIGFARWELAMLSPWAGASGIVGRVDAREDVELAELAALLRERNAVDARLGRLFKRPVNTGSVGEWIAARPFRVHIGPTQDGADVGFAVLDRLKAEMLHRVGLPELLTTATQDKGLSA
jgi:hypothetical protein